MAMPVGDHRPPAGGDGHRLVHTGMQIHGGGAGAGVEGGGDFCPDLGERALTFSSIMIGSFAVS